MKSIFSTVFLSLLAIALVAPVSALASAVEDEDYVYTNVDIERLAPIPTGVPPTPRAQDVAAWKFVEAFIARERAKLDGDRDHDLERRRVEIEERRPVGYGTTYPLYFVAPYPRNHRLPRGVNDVDPGSEDPSPTRIPHPMFRERPPVREFTPGLGDSYRGNRKPPQPRRSRTRR